MEASVYYYAIGSVYFVAGIVVGARNANKWLNSNATASFADDRMQNALINHAMPCTVIGAIAMVVWPITTAILVLAAITYGAIRLADRALTHDK